MEKRKKRRLLINLAFFVLFSGSLVVITLVTMQVYKNYKLNEALIIEREKIEQDIKILDDERNNKDYYDIYSKDNYTIYDGEVIIEFTK